VTPSPAPDRQPFLDGLRGAAALYVVLHHAWLQAWPLWGQPSGRVALATGWLLWGHFAVTFFIVISGYCLMLPLVQQPKRGFAPEAFFRRRARRILPPYYLAFALTLLLTLTLVGMKTGTHWDLSLPLTWGRALWGLTLLPDVTPTINHVYWSIGVECKIYLLFPLILAVERRLGVGWTTALFTAAGFAAAWWVRATTFSATSPHYLGLFCWGAAAAWVGNGAGDVWRRRRESPWWAAGLVVSMAVLAALCWRWGWVSKRLPLMDPFAGAVCACLLVLCARTKRNLWRSALSARPLVWVGGFSYSLYLIHAPLLQVVWQYGAALLFAEHIGRFLATVFVGVPLIVAASWVFYRYCEKPYLRKTATSADKKRLLRQEASRYEHRGRSH
jgi:peptidoglycan/LPS O-acetylase OafA/YrhL